MDFNTNVYTTDSLNMKKTTNVLSSLTSNNNNDNKRNSMDIQSIFVRVAMRKFSIIKKRLKKAKEIERKQAQKHRIEVEKHKRHFNEQLIRLKMYKQKLIRTTTIALNSSAQIRIHRMSKGEIFSIISKYNSSQGIKRHSIG